MMILLLISDGVRVNPGYKTGKKTMFLWCRELLVSSDFMGAGLKVSDHKVCEKISEELHKFTQQTQVNKILN